MNGVIILDQTAVYKGLIPGWTSFIVLGIATIILFTGIYIYGDFEGFSYFLIGLGMFGCIASVIIATISVIPNKNKIDHIEYKAIIDDTVPLKEFSQKYDILEQNGKIYTIQER